MNRERFLEYITDTDNIELISDLTAYGKEQVISIFLFECILTVNTLEVPIKVEVPRLFPYQLPTFFLPKFDELGFLPHIGYKGDICYLEKESVYTNVEEPKIVFQASVELAIETLKNGLTKINLFDFREEFNSYWENNMYLSSLNMYSFIELDNKPKKVQIIRSRKKALIFEYGIDTNLKKKQVFKNKRTLSKSGVFIPLEEDIELIPPKFDEKWNVDQFINWVLPKISKENWKIISISILDRRPIRFEYLILGIPRKTGNMLLVGVYLKPKNPTNHPLNSPDRNWELNLLKVKRLDHSSILPRGGAIQSLQNKKILIIGCGSVGSHLAIMLTKTGIGKLTLVDEDILHMENIQRYAIGRSYLGMKKVKALKDYLKANYLYIDISIHDKKIENLLDEDFSLVKDCDLIISALGDPTINLFLNQKIKALKLDASLLIGWNEPYGIGGHAILSIAHHSGCYRCLFKDRYNKSSFANREQSKPFYKKHLGCGEVFTPYSALDSIRTSELMARLSVEYLKGNINKSQLLSWKGNSTEFESQGFSLSSRYLKQNQEQMNDLKYDFLDLQCPHCGKRG